MKTWTGTPSRCGAWRSCLRGLLCALSQEEELDAEAAEALMRLVEDHVREHAHEAELDVNLLLRARLTPASPPADR